MAQQNAEPSNQNLYEKLTGSKLVSILVENQTKQKIIQKIGILPILHFY